MARLKGFEPLTHSLEGCCSIHLSYRRILKFGIRNVECGINFLVFTFRISKSEFRT